MLIIINITKMNNEKKNLKELKSKITDLMNVDPSIIKEYAKLYARIKRHGDPNIVLEKRKRVSPEHKKEVYRKYYEKVKAEREAEKERLKAL